MDWICETLVCSSVCSKSSRAMSGRTPGADLELSASAAAEKAAAVDALILGS